MITNKTQNSFIFWTILISIIIVSSFKLRAQSILPEVSGRATSIDFVWVKNVKIDNEQYSMTDIGTWVKDINGEYVKVAENHFVRNSKGIVPLYAIRIRPYSNKYHDANEVAFQLNEEGFRRIRYWNEEHLYKPLAYDIYKNYRFEQLVLGESNFTMHIITGKYGVHYRRAQNYNNYRGVKINFQAAGKVTDNDLEKISKLDVDFDKKNLYSIVFSESNYPELFEFRREYQDNPNKSTNRKLLKHLEMLNKNYFYNSFCTTQNLIDYERFSLSGVTGQFRQ